MLEAQLAIAKAKIRHRRFSLQHVLRNENHISMITAHGQEQFDWVIFASHADDTLKLLNGGIS